MTGTRAIAPISTACAALALAGCTWLERGQTGSGTAESFDGWTVAVSLEPASAGPVTFSLGPVRRAPRNSAGPWVRHEIVFENTGDRPVRFADTRWSAFARPAGDGRLLVADEGCGYTLHPRKPRLEPDACLLYLDLFIVEPHSSDSRTVTLFKDLRGMRPLVPGRYVFAKPVRFGLGRKVPAEGTGFAVTLRLVYEIERAES